MINRVFAKKTLPFFINVPLYEFDDLGYMYHRGALVLVCLSYIRLNHVQYIPKDIHTEEAMILTILSCSYFDTVLSFQSNIYVKYKIVHIMVSAFIWFALSDIIDVLWNSHFDITGDYTYIDNLTNQMFSLIFAKNTQIQGVKQFCVNMVNIHYSDILYTRIYANLIDSNTPNCPGTTRLISAGCWQENQ